MWKVELRLSRRFARGALLHYYKISYIDKRIRAAGVRTISKEQDFLLTSKIIRLLVPELGLDGRYLPVMFFQIVAYRPTR